MEIKVIKVGASVFEENEKIAEEVKKFLKSRGIISFNFMGSPGSGKTTILERTVSLLKENYRIGVIEGDIAGSYDAKKFEKFKIPVVQINTGGACHLDANMVKSGIENLPVKDLEVIFVENVGNLVCPAEFEIGTGINIVVVSVVEGDDKPKKYPLMFKISDICIVNKIDILEFSDFNPEKFNERVLSVNDKIKIFNLSAKTGKNFNQWIDFVKNSVRR